MSLGLEVAEEAEVYPHHLPRAEAEAAEAQAQGYGYRQRPCRPQNPSLLERVAHRYQVAMAIPVVIHLLDP